MNAAIDECRCPLNDNELRAKMMADTFLGGSETTTTTISAGMKLFIENALVWKRLQSDPDQYLKIFIEEMRRLESPVQSLMRATVKEVDLSGVTIPAGSLINIRFAAGNLDERRFNNPDALNLDRPRASGHLVFGSGRHHCLATPLARRELH